MFLLRSVLLAFGLILLLFIATIGQMRAHSASTASFIVFTSFRDGNSEIYRMLPDGSQQTRLTFSTARESRPQWSPEGGWIVFYADHDAGGLQIFRMRWDGSHRQRLTVEQGRYLNPVWSPNGEWIAFITDFQTGLQNVYLMRPDGGDLHRLTDAFFTTHFPAWSPDGEWLVFVADTAVIYAARPDGRDLTRVSFLDKSSSHPAWSPDGGSIAFISGGHVYQTRVGSQAHQRITEHEGNYYRLDYSPDGEWIVVGSNGEVCQFHLQRADSWCMPIYGAALSFSPNGKSVVYDVYDERVIYRRELAEQHAHRLTDSGAYDGAAVWSPAVDLAGNWFALAAIGMAVMGVGVGARRIVGW